MQVAAETFLRCTNELLENITGKDWKDNKVLNIPVSFGDLYYLNDAMNIRKSISLHSKRLWKSKENNAQFLRSGLHRRKKISMF